MAQGITGREVQHSLGNGVRLMFESVSLNADLGFGVGKSQGRPNNWTSGEAGADGEIVLKDRELDKLLDLARAAGSWEQMEEQDFTFFAQVGGRRRKVEAFGCKLGAPSFNADATNNEELTHTIPFMVSSPDFIKIDGVPLLAPLT